MKAFGYVPNNTQTEVFLCVSELTKNGADGKLKTDWLILLVLKLAILFQLRLHRNSCLNLLMMKMIRICLQQAVALIGF